MKRVFDAEPSKLRVAGSNPAGVAKRATEISQQNNSFSHILYIGLRSIVSERMGIGKAVRGNSGTQNPGKNPGLPGLFVRGPF